MAINGNYHIKQSKPALKENIFFSHDDLDLKNDMNIRGKLFVGISVEGDAGPTYHNITKTKSK
jgi:hypothetical protein